MKQLRAVRHFALSLPEVVETPHFEKASFRVGGKIFATVLPEGEHIHILIDEHEARAVLAEQPSGCEELRWGNRLAGIRITLAVADLDLVYALLEEAWRSEAPKRAVAELWARREPT